MNKSKSFSIYNRAKNFPKAADELKVQITFTDENGMELLGFNNSGKTFGTVIGYLSKEFEYTANGNYTNIFNPTKPDSLLLKILEDESQRNLMNYGYLTKKMYVNGDSPSIDISFRCFSTDSSKDDPDNRQASYKGITNPVSVANALINATLPRVGNDALLNFTSLHEAGNNALNGVGKFFNDIIEPYKKAENVSDIPGATLDAAGNVVVNSYDFLKGLRIDNLTSKKPPVCNVKIGNFFEKDMMVVKTVSVKFSKEFSGVGVPLYAEFDVTLQSLFNSASLESGSQGRDERVFGSGLNLTNSSNRVSFDDDRPKEPEKIQAENTPALPTIPGIKASVANSAPSDTNRSTANIYRRPTGTIRNFGGTF